MKAWCISLRAFPLINMKNSTELPYKAKNIVKLNIKQSNISQFHRCLVGLSFSLGLSRTLTFWSEATSVWFWLYVLVYCRVERRIILQLPALGTFSSRIFFPSVPIIFSSRVFQSVPQRNINKSATLYCRNGVVWVMCCFWGLCCIKQLQMRLKIVQIIAFHPVEEFLLPFLQARSKNNRSYDFLSSVNHKRC